MLTVLVLVRTATETCVKNVYEEYYGICSLKVKKRLPKIKVTASLMHLPVACHWQVANRYLLSALPDAHRRLDAFGALIEANTHSVGSTLIQPLRNLPICLQVWHSMNLVKLCTFF